MAETNKSPWTDVIGNPLREEYKYGETGSFFDEEEKRAEINA